MKRLLLALAVPLALFGAACTPLTQGGGPASTANQTIIDERAALGVEVMYQGWRSLVETGVDLGLVKGDLAARLQVLDRRAYNALTVARRAYDAGQASSYAVASAEMAAIIAEGTALIKGPQ